MSAGDKIETTTEKVVGTIKEGAGKLTGNEKLENEGRKEQMKADVKHAVDDVKEAVTKGKE